MGRTTPLLFAVVCSALLPTCVAAADDVSFVHDVMAVLSRSGCNLGVCHGNKNGKGGLQLSLRGQDPRQDFATLTRDLSGRRANVLQPERSLILLKPTMQVAHEGGRRFDVGSPEYEILRRWIALGLPADPPGIPSLERLEVSPDERVIVEPEDRAKLRAEAVFSDGSRRDVTRLAVYEVAQPIVDVSGDGLVVSNGAGETTVIVRYLNRQRPVRLAFIPARPDFVLNGPEPANFIDEHVFAKLRSLRMNPSPPAGDAVFLRRAYLDLLGILPTAEEARRFVEDASPDKRAVLIDALLERPEFAEFWTLKWADLLRVEEKTLDRKGVENFHAWIRRSIAHDKPLDEFARELLASRGSTYTEPASNYYRAMRDPIMRAESAAQVFLGVRLQCAKCHNHPFDRWTQDDYYSWANLFARVDYKILENNRRDRNDQHEFDGEQIVFMATKGDVDDPRTGKPLPPRVLGGEHALDSGSDRLRALAEWTGRRENDLFVRTQVNRVWHHLLGRGIVEPIDDFRATNPPSNPALLDALADDFATNGFRLKHLVRTIMNSRTYQLTAEPNESNEDDRVNFSHALVRRLSAEQLADGIAHVAGVPLEFAGYPDGMRAGQLPGVALRRRGERSSSADHFLIQFGKPPRLESCECERSEETTLGQTFQMVSGPFVNELLGRAGNRLDQLLGSEEPVDVLVAELYWTALSRPAGPEERQVAAEYLTRSADRRSALEDLAWSLLNSNEFLLRR